MLHNAPYKEKSRIKALHKYRLPYKDRDGFQGGYYFDPLTAARLTMPRVAFLSASERYGQTFAKIVRAGSGVAGAFIESRGPDFAPLCGVIP